MDKGFGSGLKNLWDQVVAPLKERMTADEYETWIRPMSPVASGDGIVEIAVPNRMFAAWVRDNFLDELADEWTRAAGRRTHFRLVWGAPALQGELFPGSRGMADGRQDLFVSTAPDGADEGAGPATAAHRRPTGLVPNYDFQSFVVGTSNQFARAAAVAVAGQPGTLYNPFFLFGGVGLGKTHLVNAIGNAVCASRPESRCLFMSADTFTNRLIDAMTNNRAQEFKNRMRKVDLIILDDVQFLVGRERTQEVFFHIFNTLYESGRQIVLTSDKFPNEIQGLEERLCSRFGWGLVADIQPPDVETRVAILERKARDESIDLPIDVASFIASRLESNIRDLEGALTRLSAWASLQRCPISLEIAKQLLGEASSEAPRAISLEEIEARVLSHFGLKPGELQARRRTRKVAEARHVAMFLMRQQAGASFLAIGGFLGGRDHSTVVHGCQAVERRRVQDPRFRAMLENLIRSLPCG